MCILGKMTRFSIFDIRYLLLCLRFIPSRRAIPEEVMLFFVNLSTIVRSISIATKAASYELNGDARGARHEVLSSTEELLGRVAYVVP